jgi:hypothetical protein
MFGPNIGQLPHAFLSPSTAGLRHCARCRSATRSTTTLRLGVLTPSLALTSASGSAAWARAAATESVGPGRISP